MAPDTRRQVAQLLKVTLITTWKNMPLKGNALAGMFFLFFFNMLFIVYSITDISPFLPLTPLFPAPTSHLLSSLSMGYDYPI